MKELTGLATGIGSLPYKEAKAAVELVLKYCPAIPFWPQLPRRDVREGMIAQFCEHLPCIKLTDHGVTFDPKDKEKELEKFYEAIINGNTDYFKISADYASGLYAFYQALKNEDLSGVKAIKCHITGPFTFAASFKSENDLSLLYEKVFMQAVVKGLTMKGLWQLKLFKEFGKKIIIFLDEPYLACFGSAYTPVNREDVMQGLKEVAQELKAQGA
ncbi:MAG: methionine synthase, partial [Candidatus Omnitrophota bacterium]|nr:methionine synthase [Candidatus Omnitrophota bacterium]